MECSPQDVSNVVWAFAKSGSEWCKTRPTQSCTVGNIYVIIEGSLEAKLPTIWTVETQSREEAERREKIRRKKR